MSEEEEIILISGGRRSGKSIMIIEALNKAFDGKVTIIVESKSKYHK